MFHYRSFKRVKEQKLKPPHTPKANGAVGVVVRVFEEAIGATRAVGEAAPTAAAQNTVAMRRKSRASRITLRCPCIRIPTVIIPIPTPLPYVPRHVIKPIAIRRKIPHRTCVEIISSGKRRMIAARGIHIVGEAPSRQGISVIVRLAPRNRVPPRKPLPAQPAPRRLLPLRLRR
jgi:hypothetical protein